MRPSPEPSPGPSPVPTPSPSPAPPLPGPPKRVRARRGRSQRGQALVLWALTLLLLGLMVLVTLGVAMRSRERVEAQMAADAAAYSQAVATARTMNAISLLTRTQASHMVAMTAVQSLISWSGQMKGALPKIQGALAQMGTDMANNPNCTATDQGEVAGSDQIFGNNVDMAALNARWKAADIEAGLQARQLQTIANMATDALMLKDGLVNSVLRDQQMTRTIARLVNPELEARPAGAGRSLTAVGVITSGTPQVAVHVTMGTRGAQFTRDRTGDFALPPAFGQNLSSFISISIQGGGGGAGYGGTQHDSQVDGAYSLDAWAEDHGGSVTITYTNGACSQSVTAPTGDAWVKSSDRQTEDDEHHYADNVASLEFEDPVPHVRHTLGDCIPDEDGNGCPGMWPFFVDYNADTVADPTNLFGQPVLYAIVNRDLTQRVDPWNLRFNFFFNPNGPGAVFDNGNAQGRMASEDAYRYQVALGTAIAYYHRPDAFPEPPNLYNPFWRATLMSMQTYSIAEAQNRLAATGFPDHADALRLLSRAGFKGFQ